MRTHPILRFIRQLPGAAEANRGTDGQLLRQFAADRDEAAFAALLHRHGAMVWRVCRDVLRDGHAAEDAFQATFLVLVRKAGSIDRPDRLGNWLYGVAYRVARRARTVLVRRRVRELRGAEMVARTTEDGAADRDLRAFLQDELHRLPKKYRSPMVLCYLEGRTNEEAARLLGWPVGTLKVRLLRGRDLLRRRLGRRGWPLSAGTFAVALSPSPPEAVPRPVVEATLRAAVSLATGAAAALPSTGAVELTRRELQAMTWRKWKLAAILLLTAGLFGAGWRSFGYPAAGEQPAPGPPARPADQPKGENKVKAEVEKLQGTWGVVALEAEGAKMAPAAFQGSKIVVQGTAFTTVSMGATYKGTFGVDVAASPKTIDLTFTEGPEAGTKSLGIYELDGDTWKLCLTVGAKNRPGAFATKAGSGLALETLRRQTGKEQAAVPAKAAPADGDEWAMVSGERDGRPLPEVFLKGGKRVVRGNEVTVSFGGQVYVQATFTLDPSKTPNAIDYTITAGPDKGKKQYGIYEADADTFRACFASPGKDRPTQFTTKAGDGQTLSLWRRVGH